MQEHIEVPVTLGFDRSKVIGWLRIRKDALPTTPNFVFSLGIKALDMSKVVPGEIPKMDYVNEYELVEVGLIHDDRYIGYLKQVGVI